MTMTSTPSTLTDASSQASELHSTRQLDEPAQQCPVHDDLYTRDHCKMKKRGGDTIVARGWFQLHVEVLALVSMGLSLKEACRASQELYLSTDMLLPLDAAKAIAQSLGSSLRCLSGFLVSNCVEGLQPAVSEVAKISTLEALTLDGTLLTGQSLIELAEQCPKLRRLSCHEILATVSQLGHVLDIRPSLEVLTGVNLSVHNELDGVEPEPTGPILSQLSRLRSLGVNLFTEHDDSVIRSVGQLARSSLTSLSLRACNFSSAAMLDCASLSVYLHTLSFVAWEDGAAVDNFLCMLQPGLLPALRTLDLDEEQASDRGLAALAALPLAGQLTALECLDVMSVAASTFEALMGALAAVERLRIGVRPLSPWLERGQRGGAAGPGQAEEVGGKEGKGEQGERVWSLGLPRMGPPGSLPRLESLSLCWCGERSWGGEVPAAPILIQGLGGLPALSRLELSEWPLMPLPDTAALAAAAAGTLRHLVLSLPQDLSKAALQAVASRCESLQHLCLIVFVDAMPPAQVPYEQFLDEIRSDFARLRPGCRCFIDIH